MPPDDPDALRRRRRDASPTILALGARMGRRRARAGSSAAASPAAVATSYEALVTALRRRRRPRAHRHDPPVASHPRGFLIVDEEGRQAGPEGQGQEGPLPGRDAVPDGHPGHLGVRPGDHRLRPRQPARGRCLTADGPRPLARRLRLLAVRRAGDGQAQRRPRGGRQQRPVGEHRLPAHRRAQPRRRCHPLARLDVRGGRQERHARAVPRELRRRARQRLAEVPGEPGRQGVRRGRDGVPRRRGRRAHRDGLAEPGGHERRPALRVRLRRHPHRQEQPRDHDRLPARGHRHRDAAVGRRAGVAGRGGHGLGTDRQRPRLVPEARRWPTTTTVAGEPSANNAPTTTNGATTTSAGATTTTGG